MERWCEGSQLLGVITHAQWEDAITHTNEQNIHVRGLAALFRRKVRLSLPFFCYWHSDAGRTLTLNRFFLSTCSNSHAWLSLIFMSWANVHIIIIITVMHFGRGETTLDLEEDGPITVAVIRLVWSMIYAESNLPEVTDLDNSLIKARHICWCCTCLCAWLAKENVCLLCVCIGRHQVSILIANNFLIVKILVFSSVDVCLCQPYILPMLCHLNITEQVINFPQASLTRTHCLLKNAVHPTIIVEVFWYLLLAGIVRCVEEDVEGANKDNLLVTVWALLGACLVR